MKAHWVFLGVFAASVMAGAGYFIWQKASSAVATEYHLTLAKNCDLQHSACQAQDNAGHAVSLQLTPNPIPLMKPITVTLQTQGITAVQVSMQVVGTNMDMGFQPVTFQPMTGTENAWQGQLILPICTNTQMQWQARVRVQDEQGAWTAHFPFITHQ